MQPPGESIIRDRLTSLFHEPPHSITRLDGGTNAYLYRASFTSHPSVIVKASAAMGGDLALEGAMLRYLDAHTDLPVPAVYAAEPDMLVMAYVPGDHSFGSAEEIDAAQHLARLHRLTADQFGFPYATLIGGLEQPNPVADSWIPFFREQRLRWMADKASAAGTLDLTMMRRLERLADDLERWLVEPDQPSLLHGDVWSGNVIARDGRIAAFLDAALYFGHREAELAFILLFSTFREPFFRAYQETHPLDRGFFEVRKDVYNLYPLLVHLNLFGASYLRPIHEILLRFGYQ
jgi:fructosamine-3-kinase